MCLQFNGIRNFTESVTEFMEHALATDDGREGFYSDSFPLDT
jgi:hypothetical protein